MENRVFECGFVNGDCIFFDLFSFRIEKDGHRSISITIFNFNLSWYYPTEKYD